jgi:hypothetical protein
MRREQRREHSSSDRSTRRRFLLMPLAFHRNSASAQETPKLHARRGPDASHVASQVTASSESECIEFNDIEPAQYVRTSLHRRQHALRRGIKRFLIFESGSLVRKFAPERETSRTTKIAQMRLAAANPFDGEEIRLHANDRLPRVPGKPRNEPGNSYHLKGENKLYQILTAWQA